MSDGRDSQGRRPRPVRRRQVSRKLRWGLRVRLGGCSRGQDGANWRPDGCAQRDDWVKLQRRLRAESSDVDCAGQRWDQTDLLAYQYRVPNRDAAGDAGRVAAHHSRDEPDGKGGLPRGMVLDPIPEVVPSGTRLQIRQVRGSAEVADFLRTGESGFGGPPNYLDVWKEGILSGASVQWSLGANYLGYAGGKPVATSPRIRTGDVAGIYFVSTLPAFRRRGFGDAMTRRAILRRPLNRVHHGLSTGEQDGPPNLREDGVSRIGRIFRMEGEASVRSQ